MENTAVLLKLTSTVYKKKEYLSWMIHLEIPKSPQNNFQIHA